MKGYPDIPMWCNAIWGKKAEIVRIHELPRCTPRILYAQAWPAHPTQAMGVFSFLQERVLERTREYIERNRNEREGRYHPFDKAVLEWLKNVDWSAGDPARLPHGWIGIEIILLPLIEKNEFDAKCLGCNQDYKPDSLIRVPETHKFGSFHHILSCPENHRLIAMETIHTV